MRVCSVRILAGVCKVQGYHKPLLVVRHWGDTGNTCKTACSILLLHGGLPPCNVSHQLPVFLCHLMHRFLCILENSSLDFYAFLRILIEGQLLMVNQTCIKLFLPDLVDGCHQLSFLAGRCCGRCSRGIVSAAGGQCHHCKGCAGKGEECASVHLFHGVLLSVGPPLFFRGALWDVGFSVLAVRAILCYSYE